MDPDAAAETTTVDDDGVVADVTTPAGPVRGLVVLAHGAGGNRRAEILRAYADAFNAHGFVAARIDLPYRQQRPKGPPSASRSGDDRDGIRRALERFRPLAPGGPVVVGGHSYGGRQASMVVAEDGAGTADVLLLSSYPLHPPGKPERRRIEHLPDIRVPTVVVHGRTDPFASADELEEAVALIDAPTLVVTVAAPHALNPARTGVADLAVEAVNEMLGPDSVN
ncbi:alpha/beta hydrolase [Gordonia sp. X0973]|uniref:alpha/beta hydrolase family protein n=1 Tax=Gordonia sp. X0973 TaxID=2742602 RepID=UPI000F52508E|nr:alpha/beta fold hydrolase [Gordonia sp. X0973]QKT07740.1 alpha/beta hydrolase [Gordonia sp. X0973]